MSNLLTMFLPDLGVEKARVVLWLKKIGDNVEAGDALLLVESDKAQIEVPSEHAGLLTAWLCEVDDMLTSGSPLCEYAQPTHALVQATQKEDTVVTSVRSVICLPDLGVNDAVVVSLLVQPGDAVCHDQPLLSVESDKAQMDVPCDVDGLALQWVIKVGDRVRRGDVLAYVDSVTKEKDPRSLLQTAQEVLVTGQQMVSEKLVVIPLGVYAGPGVRRMARENNVDLAQVVGSGLKGRVTKEDVHNFLNAQMLDTDWKSWTLSPIQRASMAHITQCWQTIPHVSHGDQVDITELDAIRLRVKKERGLRFSVLPFVMKAVSLALEDYPKMAARLSSDKKHLVAHEIEGINVAVDTDDGLMVPRLDGVALLGLKDMILALEDLGARARLGQLAPGAMAPGSITISSLGGIGGQWFTPIINAPQIAIVGVMRASVVPEWIDASWLPRLKLPLILSYDHRAVDGVMAQRFLNSIRNHLEQLHRSSWVDL